jgi:hypothetical protein
LGDKAIALSRKADKAKAGKEGDKAHMTASKQHAKAARAYAKAGDKEAADYHSNLAKQHWDEAKRQSKVVRNLLMTVSSAWFVENGGPGSGNFGHSGVDGQVGGSAPGGGGGKSQTFSQKTKVAKATEKKAWKATREAEANPSSSSHASASVAHEKAAGAYSRAGNSGKAAIHADQAKQHETHAYLQMRIEAKKAGRLSSNNSGEPQMPTNVASMWRRLGAMLGVTANSSADPEEEEFEEEDDDSPLDNQQVTDDAPVGDPSVATEGEEAVENVWTDEARAAALASRQAHAKTGRIRSVHRQALRRSADANRFAKLAEKTLGVGKTGVARSYHQRAAEAHRQMGEFHSRLAGPEHRNAEDLHAAASFAHSKLAVATHNVEEVENQLSNTDLENRLRVALFDKLNVKPDKPGEISQPRPWITDVFSDAVVYQWQSKTYKLGYSVDKKADTVTLDGGLPVRVEKISAYKPVRNDGQSGPSDDPVSNEGGPVMAKMTDSERKALVDSLIANECCWKEDDRQTLNAMPDDTLKKVHQQAEREKQAQAVVNAAREGFGMSQEVTVNAMPAALLAKMKGMKAKKDEEVEDEEVENKDKKGATCNELTEEQWMKQAPVSVRNTFRYAQEIEQRERNELIGKITANLKGDEKDRVTNRLAAKDLDELRDLAALAPPEEKQPGLTSYFGASVPTDNRRRDAGSDQDDLLLPPTINFAEESKAKK